MKLEEFLSRVRQEDQVSFAETQSVIKRYYEYIPASFSNGCDTDQIENEAEQNEGSCRIFYFASLHHLDQAQTLGLFGDYYRRDVLDNPDGVNHLNIRNFMKYGWAGIHFSTSVLKAVE
jgi:hypothetical protein